LSKYVGESE
jgi:ribosome biogenesis ATPase